mmetsp:Transcript_6975/g.23167  ORF Transcript_6975/g.23167 Transcript_6975/m.23167 type:complete len:289 (+) Transcript_6975:366-1232(+)
MPLRRTLLRSRRLRRKTSPGRPRRCKLRRLSRPRLLLHSRSPRLRPRLRLCLRPPAWAGRRAGRRRVSGRGAARAAARRRRGPVLGALGGLPARARQLGVRGQHLRREPDPRLQCRRRVLVQRRRLRVGSRPSGRRFFFFLPAAGLPLRAFPWAAPRGGRAGAEFAGRFDRGGAAAVCAACLGGGGAGRRCATPHLPLRCAGRAAQAALVVCRRGRRLQLRAVGVRSHRRRHRGHAAAVRVWQAGGVDGQEVVVRARRWRVRLRVVSSAATRASNAGAARGDRTADGA